MGVALGGPTTTENTYKNYSVLLFKNFFVVHLDVMVGDDVHQVRLQLNLHTKKIAITTKTRFFGVNLPGCDGR